MHTAFFMLEAGHTIFSNFILSGLLLAQSAASGRLRPKVAETIKRIFIAYRFISSLQSVAKNALAHLCQPAGGLAVLNANWSAKARW